MPFIGIVAKESDNNFIKNEVIKNSVYNKFEIININKESIQNFKNIKFDTIIVTEDFAGILNSSKYLDDIIKNSKYVIVNSDTVENMKYLNDRNVITYGLNQKATITISSVKKENILLCVQKNIKNVKGNTVEQQEISIDINKNNLKKIYNSMAIYTILTIYDENLKKI